MLNTYENAKLVDVLLTLQPHVVSSKVQSIGLFLSRSTFELLVTVHRNTQLFFSHQSHVQAIVINTSQKLQSSLALSTISRLALLLSVNCPVLQKQPMCKHHLLRIYYYFMKFNMAAVRHLEFVGRKSWDRPQTLIHVRYPLLKISSSSAQQRSSLFEVVVVSYSSAKNFILRPTPKIYWNISDSPKRHIVARNETFRKFPERCRLLTCVTCPEYGPDRPGFAGVISERLFIRTHAKYVAFLAYFSAPSTLKLYNC